MLVPDGFTTYPRGKFSSLFKEILAFSNAASQLHALIQEDLQSSSPEKPAGNSATPDVDLLERFAAAGIGMTSYLQHKFKLAALIIRSNDKHYFEWKSDIPSPAATTDPAKDMLASVRKDSVLTLALLDAANNPPVNVWKQLGTNGTSMNGWQQLEIRAARKKIFDIAEVIKQYALDRELPKSNQSVNIITSGMLGNPGTIDTSNAAMEEHIYECALREFRAARAQWQMLAAIHQCLSETSNARDYLDNNPKIRPVIEAVGLDLR